MKKAATVFKILAVILSYAMCICVSYLYGVNLYAATHHLTSAPPWVAFLFAIPFLIAIAICVAIAIVLEIKTKRAALDK